MSVGVPGFYPSQRAAGKLPRVYPAKEASFTDGFALRTFAPGRRGGFETRHYIKPTFEAVGGKTAPAIFRTLAIPGSRISRAVKTCENSHVSKASRGREMKAYMCVICGFVYEEAKGVPDQGIAPGTLWKDVPENWTCPDCGAPKSDFEMVEI
jgi:rubredoxin